MPGPWDEEADVVVVGYGGAGASAAIAAHDAGAKVLIIEKNEGGGSTKLATRTFLCPEHNQSAKKHILALSFGALEESIIDSFLEWTARNNDFVRELGGDVEVCPPGATFPSLPGAKRWFAIESKGPLAKAAASRCGIFSRATSKRVRSAFFAKLPLRSLCARELKSPESNANERGSD